MKYPQTQTNTTKTVPITKYVIGLKHHLTQHSAYMKQRITAIPSVINIGAHPPASAPMIALAASVTTTNFSNALEWISTFILITKTYAASAAVKLNAVGKQRIVIGDVGKKL